MPGLIRAGRARPPPFESRSACSHAVDQQHHWKDGGMRGHRGTPAAAGADAASHADSRHRVIDLEPPCRCLGQEGRVRCAVMSIVALGLTSGRKRPRGPRRRLTPKGLVRLALTDSASSHTSNWRLNVCWNGIAIRTLETLGATLIVSSRSPWRFCGGLLSRPSVGFARCRAQRGALRQLW